MQLRTPAVCLAARPHGETAVVARFLTYRPELSPRSLAYLEAVRRHPLVDRWYAEAAAEPREWLLPKYETLA